MLKQMNQAQDGNYQQQGLMEKIQAFLLNYEKVQVSLKSYCQLSRLALGLSPDTLLEAYNQFVKTPQQNHTANYRSLAGFLCHPNLNFPTAEEVQSKRVEEIIDAGKRVVGMIAYSWDYYISLLKGSKESEPQQRSGKQKKESALYSQKQVKTALKRIRDMIQEIEANGYHWQNYTKEELTLRRQNSREIQDQQAFLKLLHQTLGSEIGKISQQSTKDLPQRQLEPADQQKYEDQLGFLPQASEIKKGKIAEMIDVESYFQRKLKSKRENPQPTDPIVKSEWQRRFNAAAMRYQLGGGR